MHSVSCKRTHGYEARIRNPETMETKYLGSVKTKAEADKRVADAKKALEKGVAWEDLKARPHPSKAVEFGGETLSAREWIGRLGVTHQAVSEAARRKGISVPEEVLARLSQRGLHLPIQAQPGDAP